MCVGCQRPGELVTPTNSAIIKFNGIQSEKYPTLAKVPRIKNLQFQHGTISQSYQDSFSTRNNLEKLSGNFILISITLVSTALEHRIWTWKKFKTDYAIYRLNYKFYSEPMQMSEYADFWKVIHSEICIQTGRITNWVLRAEMVGKITRNNWKEKQIGRKMIRST